MFEVQITIKQSTAKATQRWNLYHEQELTEKCKECSLLEYNIIKDNSSKKTDERIEILLVWSCYTGVRITFNYNK